MRGKFIRQHAEAALHLVARAEQRPPSVTIVLAEQVLRELSDHLAAVGAEAERAIARLNSALEVCDAYGVLSGVPNPLVTANSFSTAAGTIIQRIRRSAIHLKGSAASRNLAYLRVIDARAPAATGKQSMKDCVIIENYFQLIKASRMAGFTQNALFLTSNTADYQKGSTPHPDLVGDFRGMGLEFTTNWEQARFSI